MKYRELTEKIAKHVVRHDDRMMNGGYPATTGRVDPRRRETVEFFRSKGHLAENPILDAAIKRADRVAKRVAKARAGGISGKELEEFRRKSLADLTAFVEQTKRDELEKLYNDLRERESQYSAEPTSDEATKRLLALQEAQLRHRFVGQTEASRMLSDFEKNGYREADLLAIGSVSEKLYQRAQKVRESLPPFVADESGIQTMGKIKELLDAGTGSITFRLAAKPEIAQRITASDLLAGETKLTVDDIVPEEVG